MLSRRKSNKNCVQQVAAQAKCYYNVKHPMCGASNFRVSPTPFLLQRVAQRVTQLGAPTEVLLQDEVLT
jgi:hypothetical protein